MKMNKRMLLVLTSIFVVALSAFVVKSEAIWASSSAEISKETDVSSETATMQPTSKGNALTMEGSICSNVSAVTPDPNTEIVFSAEGGIFSATTTHTPFINQDYVNLDTFCNVNGLASVPVNCRYAHSTTYRFNSDYINSYGKQELKTGYNGFEYIKYACNANTTSSDLTGYVTIGGRQIRYRITPDKADFKLMDWIKRKLSQPRNQGPCAAGSITNPCVKNAVIGIRG